MTDSPLRKFYVWFTVLGLLVGGLVVLGYYKDEDREWKDYQRKYAQEEIRRAGEPAAACAGRKYTNSNPSNSSPGPQPRGSMHDVPFGCR